MVYCDFLLWVWWVVLVLLGLRYFFLLLASVSELPCRKAWVAAFLHFHVKKFSRSSHYHELTRSFSYFCLHLLAVGLCL